MRRRVLQIALALGAVAGFASGFHSLGRCASGHFDRKQAFEQHIADVCVGAADRAKGGPVVKDGVQ